MGSAHEKIEELKCQYKGMYQGKALRENRKTKEYKNANVIGGESGKCPEKIKARNEEISGFFCGQNAKKPEFTGFSQFEFRARWEPNEKKLLTLANTVC